MKDSKTTVAGQVILTSVYTLTECTESRLLSEEFPPNRKIIFSLPEGKIKYCQYKGFISARCYLQNPIHFGNHYSLQ